MRSPLEAIGGTWRHAVLTTYSVSLPFFDRSVLPILEHAGIANIIVLADSDQLGSSLESLQASRAGLAYHLAPMNLGPGAFHPKLMLLSGNESARLVVSSANLTVSGQYRNLEVVVALDSELPEHIGAIQDAANFLNRIASDLAPHIASAVMSATAPVLDLGPGKDEPDVRFAHNLDEPLIGSIPAGDLTAVAPFIDGDARTVKALSGDRSVKVWLDGDHLATPSKALSDIDHEAMRFSRPLHGKAYWSTDTALVGSPNLSEAALIRTATSGNTEAALVVATDDFEQPPHDPWTGDLPLSAQARYDAHRRETAAPSARSFNAWIDADGLHADLPDGSLVEQPTGIEQWAELGTVADGRIEQAVSDTALPRVLRARIGNRLRYAVIHRPILLAAKRASARATKQRAVIEGPVQIDDDSRKVLDAVLGEVIALTELFTQNDYRQAAQSQRTAAPQSLTDWKPAHAGDEPRIPPLYSRAWSKVGTSPDTLLVLVRTALRIDDLTFTADTDVVQDLEAELTDVMDEQDTDRAEEPRPPQTTEDVLRRYRSTTRRMLERGIDAIKRCPTGDLRDLTFQVLIQQIERLAITVEVRDSESGAVSVDRLIPDEDLNEIRLEYLSAYNANPDVTDPMCANTFRYHLAYCIGLGADHWTPRQWERLGNLALTGPTEAGDVDGKELLGMSETLVTALLEPFTSRSDWSRLEADLTVEFESVSVKVEQLPIVIGRAPFDPLRASPVWHALGQAAFLGLSDSAPFVIAADNSDGRAVWGTQVLIVAPEDDRLFEILINRNTGYQRMRFFQPVSRGMLERVGALGPLALETDSYHRTIEDLPAHLQSAFDEAKRLLSNLASEPTVPPGQ